MTKNTHKFKHVMNNFSIVPFWELAMLCFQKMWPLCSNSQQELLVLSNRRKKKDRRKERKGKEKKKYLCWWKESYIYLPFFENHVKNSQVAGSDLFFMILGGDRQDYTQMISRLSDTNTVGQTNSYCFFQIKSTKPLVFLSIVPLICTKGIDIFFLI